MSTTSTHSFDEQLKTTFQDPDYALSRYQTLEETTSTALAEHVLQHRPDTLGPLVPDHPRSTAVSQFSARHPLPQHLLSQTTPEEHRRLDSIFLSDFQNPRNARRAFWKLAGKEGLPNALKSLETNPQTLGPLVETHPASSSTSSPEEALAHQRIVEEALHFETRTGLLQQIQQLRDQNEQKAALVRLAAQTQQNHHQALQQLRRDLLELYDNPTPLLERIRSASAEERTRIEEQIRHASDQASQPRPQATGPSPEAHCPAAESLRHFSKTEAAHQRAYHNAARALHVNPDPAPVSDMQSVLEEQTRSHAERVQEIQNQIRLLDQRQNEDIHLAWTRLSEQSRSQIRRDHPRYVRNLQKTQVERTAPSLR